MATTPKDPTVVMCAAARKFTDVDESTSCNQTAFKVRKKAFFYAGPQGGRFKAMFKLDTSMADAEKRAASEPDRFDVGNTGWVTARFSAEEPMPATLWKKWLKESYGLAAPKKKS